MHTFVLIHGAWHQGSAFDITAEYLSKEGHHVYTPTVYGNQPGNPKSATLNEAIDSIVSFFQDNNLKNIILVGHSYGGMIITGVANRLPNAIKRLIYCNAFVPNADECLEDMTPESFSSLADSLTDKKGGFMIPFEIWRENFMNDGTLEMAQKSYNKLNSHPRRTFTDRISLSENPSEFKIKKSYVNFTDDTALPQSLGWHPRLSEKLGVFRLVQEKGSHEVCFTNPSLLATTILRASLD